MNTTRGASPKTDPIREAIESYERGDLPRSQRNFAGGGLVICLLMVILMVGKGVLPLLPALLLGASAGLVCLAAGKQNQTELTKRRRLHGTYKGDM